MCAKSNCARPDGESEIVVTGKREKCVVMGGDVGLDALMVDMREVVRGSRAVFEDGTRIPRRTDFGGMIDRERKDTEERSEGR